MPRDLMASTEPALVPGSLIAGKYRVERTLGEGGMGIVVEATHTKLGQRVAVKILRLDTSSRADVIARFQREARIAAQLTSEHVTRVTDMGQSESGQPYLVMELLEGHDLHTEIARHGRRPVAVAVDYVIQACEALAEAHAAGLVHRDVKPANLFIANRPLGRPPIVKVLDFGLSKAPDGEAYALTRTASSFGTPQYMSPEQVRSTKHVDARTDQHALALVLYELLAGRPAYDGPSPAAMAVSIVTQPAPQIRDVRPEVPHELNDAIVRALAKDPEDRFPDVGRFARAIAPFGGPRAAESLQAISAALASERRVAGASGTEPQAAPPQRARDSVTEEDVGDAATERVSHEPAPRAHPAPQNEPASLSTADEIRDRFLREGSPISAPEVDMQDAATLPTRSLTEAAMEARRQLGAATIPMPHVLAVARAGALSAGAPPPRPQPGLSAPSSSTARAVPRLIVGVVAIVATVLSLLWLLHLGPFAR